MTSVGGDGLATAALQPRGYRSFTAERKGSADRGPGADVRAFQKLWNRNHPEDEITLDGLYGISISGTSRVR